MGRIQKNSYKSNKKPIQDGYHEHSICAVGSGNIKTELLALGVTESCSSTLDVDIKTSVYLKWKYTAVPLKIPSSLIQYLLDMVDYLNYVVLR